MSLAAVAMVMRLDSLLIRSLRTVSKSCAVWAGGIGIVIDDDRRSSIHQNLCVFVLVFIFMIRIRQTNRRFARGGELSDADRTRPADDHIGRGQ